MHSVNSSSGSLSVEHRPLNTAAHPPAPARGQSPRLTVSSASSNVLGPVLVFLVLQAVEDLQVALGLAWNERSAQRAPLRRDTSRDGTEF